MSWIKKFRKWLASLDREAWMRFLIALAGLIAAFASAELSNAFREEGNVIATAVAASVALLMAGIVGVMTVPYLAKRVAFERMRFAMQYDITREGAIYLLVCLIISIAALNTGNNLLFIIVAAMLAAILISGFFSTLILHSLDLDVLVPEYLFAHQKVFARIAVRNHNRFPAFSVNVVPEKEKQKQWQWERTVLGIPPHRSPEKQWFRLPDLQLRRQPQTPKPSAILHRGVYFPFIPAEQTQFKNVELQFEKRGRYKQQGFGFSTRFPFSFLRKTRAVPLERELLVLPPVEPTDQFFEVLPIIRGEFEAFVPGRGYDLYRIREYAPGDPARHMDWKASARTSRMMVREFTREDERKLRIIFDNPAPGALSDDGYEKAVALAASLAWHFGEENTELSFLAPGFNGPSEVLAFLKYLALVQPGEGFSLAEIPIGSAYNLVLTTRRAGSISTELWASSYFIFLDKKH